MYSLFAPPYSPVMSIVTFTHMPGEGIATDAALASEPIGGGPGIHTSEPGSRMALLATLCRDYSFLPS